MTDMLVALDEVLTYARCPLEWYWENRAHIERPESVMTLMADAVRAGLGFFYGGFVPTLVAGVEMAWRDWARDWDKSNLVTDLSTYAGERNAILMSFRNGDYKRPGGQLYEVPQMTAKFRDLMHTSGALKLGAALDETARSVGLILPHSVEKGFSVLGDAYADCLDAVRQNLKTLPARSIVKGAAVPYRTRIPGGLTLLGVADLVVEGRPDQPDAVILEVHQFERDPYVRFGLGARDLRVIAATLAEPNPEARPEGAAAVAWRKVDRVDFRYWPTGEVYNFRGGANLGALQMLVSAAARGMRQGIVVPRALSGYEDCRDCAYRDLCWGEAWQELSLINPIDQARAEALTRLASRVRGAVAGDDAAAAHARQALLEIERQLAADGDDSQAQCEALAEAFHTLQPAAPAQASANGGRHADHAG